jgi:lambda family phage portal protein
VNIRGKIADWISGGELSRIQARYEAAWWSVNRSYLPGFINNARDDINTMSRQEILRRVRYFEKNSNTMQKALAILRTNVIGTGINPTPISKDEAWNQEALAWWCEWSDVADITGQSDIPGLQTIAYDGQNIDGDHGIELMFNQFGRPALNCIECHRIGSASVDTQQMEKAGFKVFDGVMVNRSTFQPAAYLVQNEFEAGSFTPIEASRFVHFFTKKRAGQYRGISLFASAVLDLHDLDDLQKFEMVAAKDAASISKIIQSAAGSYVPDGPGIGASLRPGTNGGDPSARVAYYKQNFAGETKYTYPGDKYEQFQNTRPSAATNGFWDRLENKFAQGSGLSYAALVDYKGNWGGATLRAALSADNRLFTLRTTEQARAWQKVWEFAIGWAMDRGELRKNPEYRKVRWHPPRRTTVDVGNESASMLAELMAGVQTYEGIYGELGDDWRDRLEQRAKEEQFLQQLAAKYGVERELIASFTQERVAAISADAAEEAKTETPTGETQ